MRLVTVAPRDEAIQTVAEKIMPGDCYFAVSIKGVDGHDKIDLALERGAVAVTTEAGRDIRLPSEIHHEVVPDLRAALFARAILKRSAMTAKIAVIAGSNGKTTVKEMIVAVLSASGFPFGYNPENQNTKIGLATAVLRLPRETEFAVFEVGARHLGDFKIPLEILRPDLVTLLNVGTAHVGEFGSIENLRSEKLSILDAESATTLVVPANDEMINAFALACEKQLIKFETRQNQFSYRAPASDANFAAAQAVCEGLGISASSITLGLAGFKGVKRRFQQLQIGDTYVIDDAFNSSPESARAGLNEVAATFPHQRVLLVLGSMLELGSQSLEAHRRLGDFLRTHDVLKNAKVITVGADAKAIHPDGENFASVESAYLPLQASLRSFDVVYFKASRSLGFEQLIRRLQ